MKKNYFESILGFFTLLVSLTFLFKFVNVNTDNNETYQLKAKFLKAGGISSGNDVKMRGVKIGVVSRSLAPVTFPALETRAKIRYNPRGHITRRKTSLFLSFFKRSK